MTVISYPIPPYSNPPIQPQFYQPSRFVISNIVLGRTTLVTTTIDHNYVVGQNVRLLVPINYGSYQLNEAQGYVITIPTPDSVEVLIDSLDANSFVTPSGFQTSQAQILAIGDINTGATNSSGRTNTITYIPGSFLDISPA